MKLLISLLLTVVCVHCTPLYDNEGNYYTEKRTSFQKGYTMNVNLGLGGKVGIKDGVLQVKSENNIGPDFSAYNESVVRTYERPAVTTPPPPNFGSANCGENCILIPPSNQLSMQNRPWVMSNNPSLQNGQWDTQNGQQWVMVNNPSGQRYIQLGTPNKQLVIVNYPAYGTANGVPNGTPNDMSQQNPSY